MAVPPPLGPCPCSPIPPTHTHALTLPQIHPLTHTTLPPPTHTPAASGYTPAQRGLSWLKLKRDYLEGLADSLELVPIGAWHGQGRKVRGGPAWRRLYFGACGCVCRGGTFVCVCVHDVWWGLVAVICPHDCHR